MSSKFRSWIRTAIFWSSMLGIAACDNFLGCRQSLTSHITQTPAITVIPSTLTTKVVPGTSVQVTIAAKFVGGPIRATLSLGGALPVGVTATFSQPTVTDSLSSVMTLVADSTARPGIFQYDVIATETGTNFNVVTTTRFTGQVDPPFQLTIAGSQVVTVGTSRDVTVGVSRAVGFTAPVALSLVPTSVPAGSTVSFAPPTVMGGSSLLQIGVPANAPTGQYLVRTIGSYGATRDTATFLMTVQDAPVPPDITVVGTPLSVTVLPGASATYDLAFTRNTGTIGMGNISQSVSALPPGATATFTPIVSSTSSQLTIATTSATPDGIYKPIITATLGTIVKTTTVTLVVETPADFTMSLNAAALTVARGASNSSTVSLQRTGAVGDIAIDAQSVPAGVTVVATPAVVIPSATSTKLAVGVSASAAPGTYSILVRGVSGALTRTATLTLTIPAPPPSDVTIQLLTPTVNTTVGGTTRIPIKLTRKGTAVGQLLELRSAGIPIGGNAWVSPSFTTGDSATLYVIGGLVGTSNVVVSAVIGAFPPTDIATINVLASTIPDFSVTPAPQTLNMNAGASASMGVEIGRVNGFTGPVSFTAFGESPLLFTITFSLNSTTGSGIGMKVAASGGVAPGAYKIIVRGTSGSLVHEVAMTVVIAEGSGYPYPYYPYYPGLKRPPPP